jgi:hypothetical protein
MVGMPVISAPEKQRQKGLSFEASLGFIARPCFKKNQERSQV